jgi:GntR family transcriptional regulator
MTVDVATSLVEEVPDEVRAELDAALYLMRDRVFRVDKQRVQLATSYLDAALASGTAIEAESTGEGGTFARLRELGVEPSRFREDLRVRYPTPDEAKRLQVGSQRPVVEILRSSATEELYVVEVTHMVLVADAYVLRYHLHS